MKHRISCALVVLVLLVAAGSLWAHHSTSAVFDLSKKFTVTGTLTKVDWVNPHIVVLLDVKGTGGVENWKMESNPPAWYRRVGISRSDFAKAIGQSVKADGIRAKDGSLYAYLQKITFADGNSLELSNGSDAETRSKENPQ